MSLLGRAGAAAFTRLTTREEDPMTDVSTPADTPAAALPTLDQAVAVLTASLADDDGGLVEVRTKCLRVVLAAAVSRTAAEADPAVPEFVAPLQELIHNIHSYGQGENKRWSWRCGVAASTADPGYEDGACRYDHRCTSEEDLIKEATAHLATWHDIRPAGAVPDTGQDRGALDKIAELCGAPRGSHRENVVMAVRSMLTDPQIYEARRRRSLAVVQRLVDSLEQFMSEHGDPGAEALGAIYQARHFISQGGGSGSPDDDQPAAVAASPPGDTVQAPDVAAAVLAAAVAWKARYDEMFAEPPARGTTMRPIYDALLGTDTTPGGDRG